MYFIKDYADQIVGNPKGCKSHKSWRLLRYYLWHVYDDALKNGYTGNLIHSIKLID